MRFQNPVKVRVTYYQLVASIPHATAILGLHCTASGFFLTPILEHREKLEFRSILKIKKPQGWILAVERKAMLTLWHSLNAFSKPRQGACNLLSTSGKYTTWWGKSGKLFGFWWAAAKPVRATQLTRLYCLVVWVKWNWQSILPERSSEKAFNEFA